MRPSPSSFFRECTYASPFARATSPKSLALIASLERSLHPPLPTNLLIVLKAVLNFQGVPLHAQGKLDVDVRGGMFDVSGMFSDFYLDNDDRSWILKIFRLDFRTKCVYLRNDEIV